MTTNYENKFIKDYQKLLEKYDKKSQEYELLKYEYQLLDSKLKIKENQPLINEKDKEIARLKALLNTDGTNSGIPTSQTPLNKKK